VNVSKLPARQILIRLPFCQNVKPAPRPFEQTLGLKPPQILAWNASKVSRPQNAQFSGKIQHLLFDGPYHSVTKHRHKYTTANE
jgi:hypothetical protein